MQFGNINNVICIVDADTYYMRLFINSTGTLQTQQN